MWLGKHSSQDEKGAAGILAKNIVTGSGERPTHCRVVQGKEPDHFISLFKGEMVIKFGGVASGFKNVDEEEQEDENGPALFHVKGTSVRPARIKLSGPALVQLSSADSY